MNLTEFAKSRHLSVKRDACGDSIIPGASGHIFDGYKDGKLGVYIEAKTAKAWTFAASREWRDKAGLGFDLGYLGCKSQRQTESVKAA